MTAKRRERHTGPTYAIDTSTWIALEKRPDFDDVWSCFLVLIREKRLVTAPEIIKELAHPEYKDTSAIYALIRRFEREISHRKLRDQEFHNYLGLLHHRYPQLCKTRSRTKRPGDPYVIATAKRCGFVVVSEETIQRRPSRKIPNACVGLDVRCLTIDEMLAEVRTELLF